MTVDPFTQEVVLEKGNNFEQECIPVGCVPPAAVAISGGVSPPGIPPEQTPCKACWDTTCNACWDSTPPVNRMTNRCKNITLPQTSFAGGKYNISLRSPEETFQHYTITLISLFVEFMKFNFLDVGSVVCILLVGFIFLMPSRVGTSAGRNFCP